MLRRRGNRGEALDFRGAASSTSVVVEFSRCKVVPTYRRVSTPMRRLTLLLVACAAFGTHRPAGARSQKPSANGLLRVTTPTRGTPVPAHPFANIVVFFGQA